MHTHSSFTHVSPTCLDDSVTYAHYSELSRHFYSAVQSCYSHVPEAVSDVCVLLQLAIYAQRITV